MTVRKTTAATKAAAFKAASLKAIAANKAAAFKAVGVKATKATKATKAATVSKLDIKAPSNNEFRQLIKTYLVALGSKEKSGAQAAAFMWDSLSDIQIAPLRDLMQMSHIKAEQEGRNGERVNTYRTEFYQAYKEEGRTNPRTQWVNYSKYVEEIAAGKRDPITGKAIKVKVKTGAKGSFGNARSDRERIVAQLATSIKWMNKRGKELDPQVKIAFQHVTAAYAALGLDPKKVS